jgi:hypothetical protein
MRRRLLVCFLFLVALAVGSADLTAQAVTTSAITGRVTSTSGEPLASVQIVVINQATGTQQAVLTRVDGRYNFPGLRPGGPYRVEARGLGYRTEGVDDLVLQLGQTEQIDFVLAQEAVAVAGIDVVGERAGALISRGRTGTGTVIDEEAVTRNPTISRDFTDFIRLTPQMTASTPGTSAGGRNNRYNNIQIDGAVNNDLFGLAASGTPGGQADARPITLEAIQEFQVNLAPFDVRQGGFTGANINAVTRGGTNDFTGTLAFFGRNESLIGDYRLFNGEVAPPVDEFEQTDLAFSLGGPIVQDRAHFFVAGEMSRRQSPFGGILGVNTDPTPAEVNEIAQLVQSRYGYDPGRSDQFPLETNSDNLFARVDFQLSPEHRLTLRHNWVNAIRDTPNGGSGFVFGFSNSGYEFNSETNSSVLQLNSNFGGGIFNEFRVGMTFVRDFRNVGPAFPRLEVDVAQGDVRVGPDQFSGANALDQDVLEITNDLNFARGNHNFTIGTSNEFFRFSNLFVRNAFGYWVFPTLQDFRDENPNRYEYSYLLPGGEERAEFPVRRWSAYAQDRWDVNEDFVLTYGLRLDFTQLPKTPARNPVVAAGNIGRNTDEVPSSALQFNPRVGFNWDVYGDRSTQLRGGLGLFSGRTPFVWISNAYGNTGLDYVRFTCTGGSVPNFTADPNQMPQACAGGSATFAPNEVNTVDPDYKFPQIFRASAAIDRETGFLGTVATLEGLYTKTLNDIEYRNLLISRNDNIAAREGRAQYTSTPLVAGSGDIPVGDVIDLSNTSEGYAYNLTAQLQRPVSEGWGFNAAYTYSDAYDVNRGGSSQAVSNWRFNPTAGDPNELSAARSNFVIRHRILASYTREFSLVEGFPTLASLIWVGESGQRYTFVYNGDANGDGQTSNDLIWVPADQSQIRFEEGNISAAQSWQNLNDFIERTDCLREARGTIIDRGACQEPWFNQIDLRLAQEFRTFGSQRAEISLDILNVANLLNDEWGRREFVSNESFNLIQIRNRNNVENGRVLMGSFAPRETENSIASLSSRYQMQLGVRYRF